MTKAQRCPKSEGIALSFHVPTQNLHRIFSLPLNNRRESKQWAQWNNLFEEDEIRRPCEAVEKRVNQGAISLRRDRVLHTDVKLSRTLTDLVRESESLWNSGSTFINEKLIFIAVWGMDWGQKESDCFFQHTLWNTVSFLHTKFSIKVGIPF